MAADSTIYLHTYTRLIKNHLYFTIGENPWTYLLRDVKTPYVFIGYRIRYLSVGWGNLERSIRLINDGHSEVGVVTGEQRFST